MGAAAVVEVGARGAGPGSRGGRARAGASRATAALAMAVGLLAAPSAAGAAGAEAASCAVAWGSTPEGSVGIADGAVTGVRSGRHTCFDRVVVDVGGPLGGHHVRYVDAVTQDGSGDPVPLRGGARLLVVVGAPSYDGSYRPTYAPADATELVDARGARTLRQVASAGSLEGQTTLGIGVRARLPFRTFTLTDGATTRLVVDVAHRW